MEYFANLFDAVVLAWFISFWKIREVSFREYLRAAGIISVVFFFCAAIIRSFELSFVSFILSEFMVILLLNRWLLKINWKNVVISFSVFYLIYFIGAALTALILGELEISVQQDPGSLQSVEIPWLLMSRSLFLLGLFGVLWLFFCGEQQKRENQKLMELLREEQNNFRLLVSYERKANRFKHDLRNRVLGIQYLIHEGRTEQVLKNVEETIQQYYKLDYDFSANQYIWNVMINSKFMDEDAGQIQLIKNIKLKDIGIVDEVDFGIILGNLLDNALRAVKDPRVQNKIVQIILSKEKGFVYLEIRNTYADDMKLIHEKSWNIAVVNKKMEHGFGISNVRTLVKKYNGKYMTLKNQGYYIVRILLPCSK